MNSPASTLAPSGLQIPLQSKPAPGEAWPAAILLLLVLLLAAAPWYSERSFLLRGVEIACYIALAQMWNLLAGYAGIMSIGQQLYVGLGGYVLYSATIHWGLPVWAGIPLAAAIGATVSLPAGMLLFRLRGAQFAIGSWVLAESVMLLVSSSSTLGGASGHSLPASAVRELSGSADVRANLFWWLSVGMAVLSTLLVYFWLKSRQGLALTALRDNEMAASGLGIDTRKVRFSVYWVSAAMTSAVGALIFLSKLRMSPSSAFSLNDWTASVIFIVVIGGIGSIEGPLLGVIAYFAMREVFSDYGLWYQILMGAIAVCAMMKAPKGLWGMASKWVKKSPFSVRRYF